MTRLCSAVLLLLVAVTLIACASQPVSPRKLFREFSYQHRETDLAFAWNLLPTTGRTTVSGLLRSIRHADMADLELTISLLSRDGQLRAQAFSFIIPGDIKNGDLRAFSLDLAATPGAGDRLRFFYRFTATDGGNQGTTWMSSFEADALTGVVPGTDTD